MCLALSDSTSMLLSGRMATNRCPVCEQSFDPAQSRALPFCSERCRQIDLGRWLGEEYSLPVERDDGHDEPVRESEPD